MKNLKNIPQKVIESYKVDIFMYGYYNHLKYDVITKPIKIIESFNRKDDDHVFVPTPVRVH